jgi:putative oxidoreductase
MNLDSWQPKVLSLLRLITGLLFLEHGLQKIMNFPPKPPPPVLDAAAAAAKAAAAAAAPHAPTLAATLGKSSGWFELVGGALIVLGLFTRPVAFVLSGEMALAYFLAHAPKSFYPIVNGGELAIIYCFTFLYLVFAGPGPYSVDQLMKKKI